MVTIEDIIAALDTATSDAQWQAVADRLATCGRIGRGLAARLGAALQTQDRARRAELIASVQAELHADGARRLGPIPPLPQPVPVPTSAAAAPSPTKPRLATDPAISE